MASNTAYLTIHMIVRNEEKHMMSAIQSLLCQTYQNFVLIIADNGSTDTTGAIADYHADRDQRVTVLHIEHNDPTISYKLIDSTRTPYYMFAAGHDYYAPTFIEKCLAVLESNPNVVLAYPRAVWFKDDKITEEIPGVFDTRGMDSFSRAIVVASGLVEAYQFYGVYRFAPFKSLGRRQVIGADHVLLTELALSGSFALIDETLFFLRKADDWGDWEVYRKKHLPNETDGAKAFLRMIDAYMSIADKVNDQLDREILKQAFISVCLLRYRSALNMFGESIQTLFTKPGFKELLEVMKNTNRYIQQSMVTHYAVTPSGSDGNISSATELRDCAHSEAFGFSQMNPVNLPPEPRIKIAGEHEPNKDLTKIQEGSSFEDALRMLVSSKNPGSIIETGTYLGTGTTRIIASALRDSGLTETCFFTIECNPIHYQHAVNNLAQNGLSTFVTPLLGLSVPRSMLPDKDTIQEETIDHIDGDDIFVDHQMADRVEFYFRETDFPDIPDDLLGTCLEKLDYRPSIVLLDSAGHLGNVEFNYLIGRLKDECYIVLDDVFHIKHHKSFRQIQCDPRFSLITLSEEKFGFCIAKFTPGKDAQNSIVKSILWVRTDSIGDAVLAMSMLPHIKEKYPQAEITVLCQEHIAELYETCPHIDNIITFNRSQAMSDEKYRLSILNELQAVQADICINSVYSRDALSDFFSLLSGAGTTIALNGDDTNMQARERAQSNEKYTVIIPSPGEYIPELQRHRDLLTGIGIQSAELTLSLALTETDLSFADRVLAIHELDSDKTIVLFAGAQRAVRLYDRYGEALSNLCKEKGFSVIAMGTSKDFVINQGNLKATGVTNVNLSGKLSLRQSAAILSRCRLAVGAETGLAHIACAVNTPNVILLGGGHFGRFMPYSPLTSAVSLPLECFGCNWKCRYSQVHCVRGVRPEVLSEAILKTLDENCDSPRIFVQTASSWQSDVGVPDYADMGGWANFTSAKIIGVP